MRKILVTNDDGIQAGGLIRLVRAARKFGDVWVVAPEKQMSGSAHSITLADTFDVFPASFPVGGVEAYTCTGTPGDCVRAACMTLLPEKPDVVLSGINYGYNAATDLQYSATVGAAFEGAFQGCRAIALSEDASECHETTDAWLESILSELIDAELDYGQIWNVNFPSCPAAECRGILRDRAVSRAVIYTDTYPVTEHLPGGGMRLRVHGVYTDKAEEGTDFRAVLDGYISVGIVNNVG